MQKALLCFVALLAISLPASQAQFVDFRSFFRPGLRMSADWIPNANLDDTTRFGMQHYRVATILPLKTNVGLDLSDVKLSDFRLKDLNAKASQRFVTFNAGMRQMEMSRIGENRQIWNATIGITGIKASIKTGFWLWTANLGFVESLETDLPNPFFVGGIVHARIKGIHKQNFLGLALTAGRHNILPIPIVGWRRKLMSKTHINIFLPIHLSIDRKLGKNSVLVWSNNFTAMTTMFSPDRGSELVGANGQVYDPVRLGYGGLRSGLSLKMPVMKSFKIQLTGGVSLFDGIRLLDPPRERLISYNRLFHPYATLTLFYKMGNKGISSELFGNEI